MGLKGPLGVAKEVVALERGPCVEWTYRAGFTLSAAIELLLSPRSLLRSPRPHRRSLYTDNGRHKNKNQAAPAPTGNGRHKTNKHEAATARARDLAPRARGTDASIPSGRAGTDGCADAD